MMGLEELNQSVSSIIFKDCFHFNTESSDGESEPTIVRDQSADSDWVSSDRGLTQWGRSERPRLRFRPKPKYRVQAEYTQPQGYISRSADGRFVLEDVEGSPAKRRRTGDLPPWLSSEPLPVKRHDYVNTHSASAYLTQRRTQYPGPQESPVIESGFYRIGGGMENPAKPILRREYSTGVVGQNQGFLRTPGRALLTPSVNTIYNPSSYYTPGNRTMRSVRSSSPGPNLGSFMDDLSSVAVPSSVERSFPSTLLTSGATPQDSDVSRELPSLAPISERLSPRLTLERHVTPVPLDTPVRRIQQPPHFAPHVTPDALYVPLGPSNLPSVRPRRQLLPLSINTALPSGQPSTLRAQAEFLYPSPVSAAYYPTKSTDSRSQSSGSHRIATPVRFTPQPGGFMPGSDYRVLSEVRQVPLSPGGYSTSSGSQRRTSSGVVSPQLLSVIPSVPSGFSTHQSGKTSSYFMSGYQARANSRVSSPDPLYAVQEDTSGYVPHYEVMHGRHPNHPVHAQFNYKPPSEFHPPQSSFPLSPELYSSSREHTFRFPFSSVRDDMQSSAQLLVSPSKRRIFPYLSPPGSPRKKSTSPRLEERYPLLPESEQRPLATSSPPRFSDVRRAEPQRHSITSISSGRGSAQVPPPPPQQESISSSSGFDSRNTSQQNQSGSSGSQSGLHSSGDLTRLKPVPRVRAKISRSYSGIEHQYANVPPPLPREPPPPLPPKSATGLYRREAPPSNILDASVDNQYEFDSAQSPAGTSDTQWENTETQRTETSLYIYPEGDRTVEARVKAIRQEYELYRKKRERLESAC